MTARSKQLSYLPCHNVSTCKSSLLKCRKELFKIHIFCFVLVLVGIEKNAYLSDVIELPENELRWRKSSHAAILSSLPSHQRISPASVLANNLGKSIKDRRASLHQLCSSTSFYTGLLSDDEDEDDEELERQRCRSRRRSRQAESMVMDQKAINKERKESIKCLTAPINVKRKFRLV